MVSIEDATNGLRAAAREEKIRQNTWVELLEILVSCRKACARFVRVCKVVILIQWYFFIFHKSQI